MYPFIPRGIPLHPGSRNSGYEYGISVTIGDIILKTAFLMCRIINLSVLLGFLTPQYIPPESIAVQGMRFFMQQ